MTAGPIPEGAAAAVKGFFNGALGSVHVGDSGEGRHGEGVSGLDVPVGQQAEGVNIVIPAARPGVCWEPPTCVLAV